MRRPIARDQNQRKRAVGSQVANWSSGYPSFAPNSLPGLQLWLDAADTATITESGGAVSQWNDKSGNAYHVTQGTGAAQPTLISSGLNGLNVISFDGNDVLARASANILGKNVTGLSAYFVVLFSATTAFNIFQILTNTSVSRVLFSSFTTAGKPRFVGRTLDGDSAAFVDASTSVSTTSYQTLVGVYDYANTDLFLYLNGVLDGSNTSFQTATTTSNTDSAGLYVGGTASPPSLNGRLAEILVYHSAHTTQERAAVLKYFKQKWNV